MKNFDIGTFGGTKVAHNLALIVKDDKKTIKIVSKKLIDVNVMFRELMSINNRQYRMRLANLFIEKTYEECDNLEFKVKTHLMNIIKAKYRVWLKEEVNKKIE